MYPISDIYEEFLRRLDSEPIIKAVIDGKTYDNTTIVDMQVVSSVTLSEEFRLGSAIFGELTIRISTQDVIAPGAKIVPYIALSLANMRWIDAHIAWKDDNYPWAGGMTEWMPLGEFYVDSRHQDNDVWEYTCCDKLVLADVPYISQLTYPATMQAAWNEICDSLDYVSDSSVVIDESYMIEVGPAGYTKRQVMGYIASANAACVAVGKDGKIQFKTFAADVEPAFAMGTSDYIYVQQTNPVKTYTRIVVTYDLDDQLTYEAGEGDEDHTLYVENPFMTQGMVNDLQAALDGFSYIPLTMDSRGFPHLEPGDTFSFGKRDSRAWNESFVAWKDAQIPWNGIVTYQSIILHQTITYRGGLNMTIDSPSLSAQASETKVDGQLTTAVNSLRKTSVRKGRPVYGVTITDDEGWTVERSDHKSKVVWNSDELAWKVNGADSLYYDALAGKLKYKGDIEMEGGSIDWTSVDAPGIEDIGTLSTRLTHIGPDGIYTGILTADQVNAIEGLTLGANASIDWDTINSPGIDNVNGLTGRLTHIDESGIYTGTLTADQINAIVGLTLGANATINWDAVAAPDYDKITGDKPPSDADNTTTTIGADRLTKITSTGVYTGEVETDQLVAGTSKIGSALIDHVTTDQITAGLGKISTALIDDLVVGSNVQMGPTATINWNNVTNQPSIPNSADDIGALSSTSPKLTYIGPTGIYTGILTAQQVNSVGIDADSITTGTLTGRTVRTAETGTRVELSSGFADINLYHESLNILTIQDEQVSGEVAIFNPSAGKFYIGLISAGTVYPRGVWDFTMADIANLNVTAKFK